MPTRKIKEPNEEELCLSPEHSPPSPIVFEPGTYEHICPMCGKRIVFTVPVILS